MLPVVVCAVLAQAPQPLPLKLVVVQGSNLAVPLARAAELTRAVIELARLEGMDAAAVEVACSGQQCSLTAARENGADAVVTATFAALGEDAVMDLECRVGSTGELIAQTTLTVRATTQADLVFEHLPFLRQVKRALSGGAEAPEPDVKPAEPPPRPPEPPVALTATPRRSALPFFTGAVSVASAVAGATLFAVNGLEAQSLGRSMHDGLLSSERVADAYAFDDRARIASVLLAAATVALALTVVIALIP